MPALFSSERPRHVRNKHFYTILVHVWGHQSGHANQLCVGFIYCCHRTITAHPQWSRPGHSRSCIVPSIWMCTEPRDLFLTGVSHHLKEVVRLWAKPCLTLRLCDPRNNIPPGSSELGFSRQECWSRLLFPPQGDLPNPGTEPSSPALADGFFFFF